MADVFKDIVYKTKTLVNRDVGPLKRTSNERNNGMLVEAETCSHALRALAREISSWSMHADVGLSSISTLLHTPIPRIFDETLNGHAYPVGKEHKLVGGDVRLEEITKARRELVERLHRDVLYPLSLWQDALNKIRLEHKKVEDLRADLDDRRMKHALAQQRQEAARAEGIKATTVESLAVSVQQEADKVARLAERFNEAERAVHQSLMALIQDLHVLRDYMLAAVTLMNTALTTALGAFRLPEYVPEWTLPEGMLPTQVEELAHTRPPTYNACPDLPLSTPTKDSFSTPISAAAQSSLAMSRVGAPHVNSSRHGGWAGGPDSGGGLSSGASAPTSGVTSPVALLMASPMTL